MSHAEYSTGDFGISPLMFYYEVTLACDLVCKHCRASAQEKPDPGELSTDQAEALLDQVAGFPRRPMLVMTGGDPLKRADLFELIRHAGTAGLQVALTPSATPLATFEAFQRVRQAGVRRLGISLDGADAATHDAFRGWQGSFQRTMQMLAHARTLEMAVQVNTTITRRNVHQIDALAELLAGQGIAMWSVFFLVPVGRGIEEQRIAPEEYETVFERLWHHAQCQPYAVKTTEAPHYRRFVLERGGDPLAGPRSEGRERERGRGTADEGWAVHRPLRRLASHRLAAIGRRWASATARASCSSATRAKSIRPVFCRCAVGGSRRTPWSTCTRSTPYSWPSATPIGSRAGAASASTGTSAAAAAPERTPSPAITWRPSRIASTCRSGENAVPRVVACLLSVAKHVFRVRIASRPSFLHARSAALRMSVVYYFRCKNG